GSITVTVNGDAVVGPGDIGLTAGVDILTGGGQAAVASSGGNVVLTAGRDLLLGDVANFARGDLVGGGGVGLQAGRDLRVDVGTAVAGRGAGTVQATAGGDIALEQSG